MGTWSEWSPWGTWSEWYPWGTWSEWSPWGTWFEWSPWGTWIEFSPWGTWTEWSPWGTWSEWSPWGTWTEWSPWGTWSEWSPWGTWSEWSPWGTWSEWSPWGTWSEWSPWGTWTEWYPWGTKRKASAALLPPVIMEGESLESVYPFDYLGCRFTSDGDDAADMRHRMAIAGERSRSLDYLWRDNRLPRSLKLRLYAASVCSTLTPGSEAWMLTPRALATLN